LGDVSSDGAGVGVAATRRVVLARRKKVGMRILVEEMAWKVEKNVENGNEIVGDGEVVGS
jgi:hypothetical protein